MGIIYFNIGLAIINFILACINTILGFFNNKSSFVYTGLFNLVIALFISYITYSMYDRNVMTKIKEEDEIEAYYKINNLVEKIKQDTTILNKTDLLFSIESQVDEINEIIEINRNNYDSRWNGYQYSEKIGNLKKIRLY